MDTPSSRNWYGLAKSASLQFLAVFLGVSMSFLAENWRQSLGERHVEKRVLAGIAADLASDSVVIQRHAEVNTVAAAAGLWLHRNWHRDTLPSDSLVRALSALHRGSPYSPLRAEYESAKAAARLPGRSSTRR